MKMEDHIVMMRRSLGDIDEPKGPVPTWQVVYTIIVLCIMFAVLITDKVRTDSVMLTALTAFYIAEIITIKEALMGFSSQGLLTVLVLFVVAEGLNKTGALNWYVAKALGRPTTLAGAQMRVMIPVALLSGFINDTPLVTITLPVVIQWSKKINLSTRFLLIPLSFAALLGGVCTLIGTSTNLVIVGLLQEYFPDDPKFQNLNLFGLSIYGVPVTCIGIAYVLLATPFLLARSGKDNVTIPATDAEDVLLPARLTQWSPAAGRTVQRSGLRDTGGIYLVRVQRGATGNVHHAVGPDFALQVGDILFFTGLVESFGDFCAEHGLEVVIHQAAQENEENDGEDNTMLASAPPSDYSPRQIGSTLDSILQSTPGELMRQIYYMEDTIRQGDFVVPESDETCVIVTMNPSKKDMIVIAIDTVDRPGLLLDISKVLARLELNLHHTEAAAGMGHSVSIWRCEAKYDEAKYELEDRIEEIWSVIHSFLTTEGVEAAKKSGLPVIRAQVKGGRLDGKTAQQINFRNTYKAGIVALYRNGKAITESLAVTPFAQGDILILQADQDSPLLRPQTADFVENKKSYRAEGIGSLFSRKPGSGDAANSQRSNENLNGAEQGEVENIAAREAVWNDLQVLTSNDLSVGIGNKEFLTAMKVDGTQFVGKTVSEAGIDKLPDIILVSIERRVPLPDAGADILTSVAVPMSDPLAQNDILWFSGTPAGVGDLRKIPGLLSYEDEEVSKIKTKVFDRRLVQAVVARKGPLVGKTVKEVRFRTLYGAAVIAVQREALRVHDHPGNVKLLAGDVLLLEAGPSFMANKLTNEQAFTLIAEVKDSAPPRLRMLIPAIVLTVGAYACFMGKLSTLWGCAMVAAILMVILGVMSENEAFNAIQWPIYLTIASAFGIGTALVNSGVADAVADFLVKVGNAIGMGDAGLLGAVYLSTVLISQLVANNAAAALIFPIAMEAAKATGIDITLMSYCIMLAASAAFMTPFGYQTNLMVMGPGGYSTTDYLIFGTPMQIVLLIATTIFLVSPWWVCWLVSFIVAVAAAAFSLVRDRSRDKIKSM